MNLTRLVTALAVALTLALSGCSDDPDPKLAPSTNQSTSSSVEPSSSPSAPPRALDPEETVQSWIKAQNVALLSGEMSDLERLSTAGCDSCAQSFLEPIQAVYDAGGRFETDGWTVDAVKVREPHRDLAIVDVGVTIAGGRTFEDSTAEPVTYKTEHRIMLFKVRTGKVVFVGFVS